MNPLTPPVEWISVKERLPESDGSIQLWCYDEKEGVTTGYHHHGGHFSEDNEYSLYAVTHWKPLLRPEPPE